MYRTPMKNATRSEVPRPFEKLIVGMDSSPWGAVCRGTIGFLAIPATSWLWGGDRSGWMTVPLLLVILLMLRVVPALLRRLMPFSDTARGVWYERRQLAKRYDSYQWRKLFWIGVGFAFYSMISGRYMTSRIVVSAFCLLSGALGLAMWRAFAPRTNPISATAKQARDSAY